MSTKYDDLMLEFESADEAFEDEQFKNLFSAGEYAACLDALFYGDAVDDAIDLWEKLIDEGKNPLQGSDGIDEEQFYQFEYFPKLTIVPGTVEAMGLYCFSESNLVDVILEPGVVRLNGYNFANCKKLRSIYIPKTVKHISTDVFAGCNALKTINFGGTKEQWDSLISGDEGINKKCVVNFNVPVPNGGSIDEMLTESGAEAPINETTVALIDVSGSLWRRKHELKDRALKEGASRIIFFNDGIREIIRQSLSIEPEINVVVYTNDDIIKDPALTQSDFFKKHPNFKFINVSSNDSNNGGTINEGYDRSKYHTKRSIKTNPDSVGIGHWINNYR